MKRALEIVERQEKAILADAAAAKKEDAVAALGKLRTALKEFVVVVDNKDKQEARRWRHSPRNALPATALLPPHSRPCPLPARATSGRLRRPLPPPTAPPPPQRPLSCPRLRETPIGRGAVRGGARRRCR